MGFYEKVLVEYFGSLERAHEMIMGIGSVGRAAKQLKDMTGIEFSRQTLVNILERNGLDVPRGTNRGQGRYVAIVKANLNKSARDIMRIYLNNPKARTKDHKNVYSGITNTKRTILAMMAEEQLLNSAKQ